jgi:hypothetical protein
MEELGRVAGQFQANRSRPEALGHTVTLTPAA